MSQDDGEFRPRPGKARDAGRASGRKAQSLATQVRRASAKAGATRRTPLRRSKGTGARGRGRAVALRARFRANGRRVVIKARVVRHKGARFRAAPLGRHVAYLKRDGVTRDGQHAELFDASADLVDGDAFAERSSDDRHHFRFIVSPEDAADLDDLRTFTRELMDDVAKDLGTGLEWVAVDHWNTDNPHVHILVRGRADDGSDLVIDKDYIREGMRFRAEERATLELGPRSAREIGAALDREIDADRWTSLDQRLQEMADEGGGVVDLRPGTGESDAGRRRLLGRAAKLDRMGLADNVGPAVWALKPDIEPTLRDIGDRGDIIRTMHRAMSNTLGSPDPSRFAVHAGVTADPVVGRLVERGLHDELAGSAYAVVDGSDGRVHHLRFDDIDMTGDSKPGSIVELRRWTDRSGAERMSLSVRSDLTLSEQIRAKGATWVDRQLVSREVVGSSGFGREIREAIEKRADRLVSDGLAHRQGRRLVLSDNLIDKLRARELADTVAEIERSTGLQHRPSGSGDHVSGIYRERVNLSSGRFAMIDDGLGFQLVPWRPAIDGQIGRQINGVMSPGGSVQWTLGRGKGLSI